jgi:uncharacterized protein YeaO (DUF488 family)
MRILTDYYGNYKNWHRDAVPVSVSRFPPAGYKGLEYKDVAPEEWLLEAMKTGNITQEFYIKAYRKQLDGIGRQAILKKLRDLSDGKDVILVCYEKDGDFCHRHLLKYYLEFCGNSNENGEN